MDFKVLDASKRSARLNAELYKATKELKDYVFRDQLTRNGLLVPSNIAKALVDF